MEVRNFWFKNVVCARVDNPVEMYLKDVFTKIRVQFHFLCRSEYNSNIVCAESLRIKRNVP